MVSNIIPSLDEENAQDLQDALEKGLESIRLFDWEFKMKLRYVLHTT